MECRNLVNLQLVINSEEETNEKLKVVSGQYSLLPRVEPKNKTFLGWNIYKKLKYGFMNYMTDTDSILYAICTDGPAYVIESHFRGVPGDAKSERSHFRRYVLEIYLENTNASCGKFRIENCNHILYYLGSIPCEGIKLSVDAETNRRGGAYNNAAYFTTSHITVEWKSEKVVDATQARKKIVTLMLCFSKWGMYYEEIERRTSDEIVIPAYDYKATVDGEEALVSANFYHGVIMEDTATKSKILSVRTPEELSEIDFGHTISRFAVLADAHIGFRYKWENYDWLLGVFANLKKIHETKPLDFVLQLGDTIDDGYDETYKADYECYLNLIKEFEICDAINPIEGRDSGKIPHYELQGNHDPSTKTRFFRKKLWFTESEAGEKVAYIGFFTNYGGYPAVNFNIADNYSSYCSYGVISDEMVDFVENSILKAKQENVKHIILCSHFGVAQSLTAPILPETGLGKIENLCKKFNIKLYLNGHEHNKAYAMNKVKDLYTYDAAIVYDKYAVFDITEKYAKVTIYNTSDNSISRIDVVDM